MGHLSQYRRGERQGLIERQTCNGADLEGNLLPEEVADRLGDGFGLLQLGEVAGVFY